MKIYHTETQADYDALMVELEEQGAVWLKGINPTEENNWPEFERQTGIKVQDCRLTFHGVEYFERENPETPIIKYTAKKEMQLPEWANWLARDRDDELWCFKTKPYKEGDVWNSEDSIDRFEIVDDVGEIYNLIQWTDKGPTEVIWGTGLGMSTLDKYKSIMNAKAHGYDEVPEVIQYDWLAENRMVNEADEIADKRYETPDIINEPNHYKGKHGIETIDVIRNFGNDDMVAGFYWGNAIKYMTRYRNKNGLEDLKKARRNLDWLIEHTEKVE